MLGVGGDNKHLPVANVERTCCPAVFFN